MNLLPFFVMLLVGIPSLHGFGISESSHPFDFGSLPMVDSPIEPEDGISDVTWFGLTCFILASIWVYWTYMKSLLTPYDETERRMLEIAKRFRQCRSLEGIVDSCKVNGASEEYLAMIKQAPEYLKARGLENLLTGVGLVILGILFSAIAYGLNHTIANGQFLLALLSIFIGFRILVTGYAQWRAFR